MKHRVRERRASEATLPRSLALVLAVGVVAAGCGGPARRGAASADPPDGPLELEAARAYVLALVNRDRAENGVPELALDPIASVAAQRHAEDMAAHGFTAHWGTDGTVPEQRYTEAGGLHMVQENAFCFVDGVVRALVPRPEFSPAELERVESAFLAQIPPNDSHRRNVLMPFHNRLGVGLAKLVDLAQPCLVELFVDAYGDYAPVPATARIGERVEVAGELQEPVEFCAVGVGRLEPAQPLEASRLAALDTPEERTYRIPDPHATYFPEGGRTGTAEAVTVSGRRFSAQVTLDDQGRPGRYEISVWGRHPGSDVPAIVSLRTIDVRRE